jgi:hypothetical protein
MLRHWSASRQMWQAGRGSNAAVLFMWAAYSFGARINSPNLGTASSPYPPRTGRSSSGGREVDAGSSSCSPEYSFVCL